MFGFLLFLLIILLPLSSQAGEASNNYYTLNRQNGLSSNHILQMLQLTDGRMVIVTDRAVDIYDGHRLQSVAIDTTRWVSLPSYTGATHLYADSHHRLWLKQWGRLYCLHLPTLRWEKTKDWTATDFFITQNGETWVKKGQTLQNPTTHRHLQMPAQAGNLQDVMTLADSTYAFFSTGKLAVYQKDGRIAYLSEAYGEAQRQKYASTSLVVLGADRRFYQVRTGSGGSILQSFDPHTHQWHQLMTSSTWMHTLTPTPTGMLYLTTPDGYLRINPTTGEKEFFKELHLPDGTTLTTGINTVWLDREGGIWLGTYNNGLLYTSPLSGLFDTRPIDIEVHPILSAIYLHGQPLQVGQTYGGDTLLSVTPPYTSHLSLAHDQNSLAFQFSTMNYVRPRSTYYRYRLSGISGQWHILSADTTNHQVDDKGIFYLPLVSLSPGHYTLEVMATTNPAHWNPADVRRITFTIRPPWWQTPIAYLTYLLLGIAALLILFGLYRRHLQRKSREDMLLLRIQNLVEQINRYEHSEAIVMLNEPDPVSPTATLPEPTPQEKEFMARATLLVEQHITDPTYNVERLAADLCMERTGLYKRLTHLMQQSPVAFIRSIRLHRAARMLQEGNMTVTDIAQHTGFGSTSYFSKCFQKEFGCKPSEFSAK